ncbi:hypothetical protein [Qipengyuania sp.]|uniref:hypothetical protein n=1 Tax=Qipengyuania sp. TaxID=2004515 RepID=UPI0035123E19
MKIDLTMLTGMSGPKINVTRGDPYSTDLDEAARMVRGGLAQASDTKGAKAVEEKIAEMEAEEAAAAEAAEKKAAEAAKKAAAKK